MNKQYIIAFVMTVPFILGMVIQTVDARNGIPGNTQARIDFLESGGEDKDTSCDPNEYSDAYCTGYKVAYEIQWMYMTLQYDCSDGECR